MSTLTPKIASSFARDVYSLTDGDKEYLDIFLNRPEFSTNAGDRQALTANVGFRIVNVPDLFGFCANGGKGYEQDVFLIFRGSTKLAADWMTNFRMGLNRGQHIGFKSAFESMLPEIEAFFSTAKPGATVHCVGHSLGGAVAAIAAEWIAFNRTNEVKLYTFGAPKPGTYFFAKALTKNVNIDNIFRVFHPTDPVPMTPMFPFVHPPKPGFGHLLQSNEGLIGTASHNIVLYAINLEKQSWLGLNRTAPPFAIEHKIKEFLQSNTPVTPNTPKIFEWINAGLIYVLTKIVGHAIDLASFAMTGLMTIADTISYILIKGYKLTQTVWVEFLITKMMQALGMPLLKKGTELTHDFLITIMLKMMRKNNDAAQKAIAAI